MKMDWLSEKNIDCKKTKTGMHACLDGWMDGMGWMDKWGQCSQEPWVVYSITEKWFCFYFSRLLAHDKRVR
jgi:hypothetical protein